MDICSIFIDNIETIELLLYLLDSWKTWYRAVSIYWAFAAKMKVNFQVFAVAFTFVMKTCCRAVSTKRCLKWNDGPVLKDLLHWIWWKCGFCCFLHKTKCSRVENFSGSENGQIKFKITTEMTRNENQKVVWRFPTTD